MGKLFGNIGDVGKDLIEKLFVDEIHLILRLKKDMSNALMLLSDKMMFRKFALIEAGNDQLKNICQIEHIRHQNFDNFVINILSALASCSFLPQKPSDTIDTDIVEQERGLTA